MLFETFGLRRTYRRAETVVTALEDVSLNIRPGELVAVVGPAACGKSTLMQILGLIDSDFLGEYFFAGRDVRRLTLGERAQLRLRRIGIMFQGSCLLPSMSVLDNVALPSMRLDGSQPRARERASSILADLGLADVRSVTADRLGLADRQLVSLARALVNDPWVVLADEPFGGMHAGAVKRLLDGLAELHSRDRTVVISSRDPSVEARVQRVIHLEAGRAPIGGRLDLPDPGLALAG